MTAQVFVYLASYLYFPAMLLLAYAAWRWRNLNLWLVLGGVAFALSLLAYARFLEPRRLHVEQTEIVLPGATETSATLRIALVSDMHIGVFKNAMPLERIVNTVNAQDVDAVFIAGDFTHWTSRAEVEAFAPALAKLEAPAFGVVGNHDMGFPGVDATFGLVNWVEKAGVAMIDNRLEELEISGQTVRILGTSDYWLRHAPLNVTLPDDPANVTLVLVHNPDTALFLPPDLPYDLMLAGHTHGGQIRLPFVYQAMIPTDWPFDKGLHRYPTDGHGDRLVYVTPGTGMIGLPMRFGMPPQVDILTLRVADTAADGPVRD